MNDKLLKYYIETWGCQMNEEDSEKLSKGIMLNGIKTKPAYFKMKKFDKSCYIYEKTCQFDMSVRFILADSNTSESFR